jgi:hypothetical protein
MPLRAELAGAMLRRISPPRYQVLYRRCRGAHNVRPSPLTGIGYWGATEQNAELRILLQIRSAIKSGVTEGLRNRCKQVRGSAARFTPHFPEIRLPAGK